MSGMLFKCHDCGKYVRGIDAYTYNKTRCLDCHKHLIRPRFKAMLFKLLPDRIIDYYPMPEERKWGWRRLKRCRQCGLYRTPVWIDHPLKFTKHKHRGEVEVIQCYYCHIKYPLTPMT